MNKIFKTSTRLKKKIYKNKRTISSRRWLERQINDPFVIAALEQQYRSRSAFKLIELNKKFSFFQNGNKVIDLGCSPGGWSQVAVNSANKSKVIAVDIKEMKPLNGVDFVMGNIFEEETILKIKEKIDFADIVISDMAPSSIGHKTTDQIRSQNLAESAFEVAEIFLKRKGKFCTKIILGGETQSFVNILKEKFEYVKRYKPISSRKDSAEIFLIGLNYRQDISE